MNAAIVFFSNSGNTAAFARILAEALRTRDIECDLHALRPATKIKPGQTGVSLKNDPIDLSSCDILLTGTPVWGMQAVPLVTEWIMNNSSLKGKKAAGFVTQALPFAAIGGKTALSSMNRKLDAFGATVLEGEIVPGFFGPNRKKMAEAAARITERLLI